MLILIRTHSIGKNNERSYCPRVTKAGIPLLILAPRLKGRGRALGYHIQPSVTIRSKFNAKLVLTDTLKRGEGKISGIDAHRGEALISDVLNESVLYVLIIRADAEKQCEIARMYGRVRGVRRIVKKSRVFIVKRFHVRRLGFLSLKVAALSKI